MANDKKTSSRAGEAVRAAEEAAAAAEAALAAAADEVGDTRRLTDADRAVGSQVFRAAFGDTTKAKPVKPSSDFTTSMERTLASLDAQDAPKRSTPATTQASLQKKPAPKPAAERDEVGELIQKYAIDNPPTVTRQAPAPVLTSQDHVEAGLARVTNPKLTQVQRTETFINELATNKHFAARFGVNANSAGKLDLNGDRQVEPREYEAVANTLWRDARFKSVEKIAETLGNDKQIADAARAFGGSMQEGSKVAQLLLPKGDPDKGGHHK